MLFRGASHCALRIVFDKNALLYRTPLNSNNLRHLCVGVRSNYKFRYLEKTTAP